MRIPITWRPDSFQNSEEIGRTTVCCESRAFESRAPRGPQKEVRCPHRDDRAHVTPCRRASRPDETDVVHEDTRMLNPTAMFIPDRLAVSRWATR